MKRTLLALFALFALVAVPATASAAPPARGSQLLVAGPLKVKAYMMYLLVAPKSRHHAASLVVLFDRAVGHSAQQHYYGFSRGLTVKIAPDGRSASVKGDFGAWGKVDLSFAAGEGHISLPAGCHGAVVNEDGGGVTGNPGFRLVSHSPYFKTVRTNSLRAYVITAPGGVSCLPKPNNPTHAVQLSATGLDASADNAVLSFNVTKTAQGFYGADFTMVERSPSDRLAPVIIHGITASKLSPSVFTVASDLSTAHANGAGPFLSGSLNYTARPGGSSNETFGAVAGQLSAQFDGIGAVSLPLGGSAPTTATLHRS